jgi:hypothetical protein
MAQMTCDDYRITIAENLDYRLDTGATGVEFDRF